MDLVNKQQEWILVNTSRLYGSVFQTVSVPIFLCFAPTSGWRNWKQNKDQRATEINGFLFKTFQLELFFSVKALPSQESCFVCIYWRRKCVTFNLQMQSAHTDALMNEALHCIYVIGAYFYLHNWQKACWLYLFIYSDLSVCLGNTKIDGNKIGWIELCFFFPFYRAKNITTLVVITTLVWSLLRPKPRAQFPRSIILMSLKDKKM